MTAPSELSFPTTIGEPSIFAIRVALDEHYNGEWLFGKIGYVIGGEFVGDYDLGTSLRDVLLQMTLILSDANRRKTIRFEGLSKETIFNDVWTTLFGDTNTGLEKIAQDECWVKHNITIPVDVFDNVKVFQFDEQFSSRIIWREMPETNDAAIREFRIPIGVTETVFKQLFEILNELLLKEEIKRGQIK
ncbi:MAG: Imm42 family immunity protein [Pirellulaceae bacterium]